ncbi:class I SAM-dependent methyltransferase [Neptunitalea lumnitzerae]|uniref:Methyltransferase n=1 Tax=Neptunitalea lumnitzerae TaxID=2965509 RepID=A0ABQ5MGV5_9FLAO|nr:class I SAM-dependent methyltransferase [Neptunitalea sp. Y10]GLB48625.1 methyltransferase [Neptunitalea sp. Y10]
MKDFWDERYGAEAFAYGEKPNEFLKEKLSMIPHGGTVLFPAEGEGRNAVYAATEGYNVSAFDMSALGREKALQLADKAQVTIAYKVADLASIAYDEETFDGLVLVYSHFPAAIREQGFKKLCSYVKPGGKVIFECFSKAQLQYTSGGPKQLDMLFSLEEVKTIFSMLEFDVLEEKLITLEEGLYHNGKGSVIRFTATKIAS